MLFLLRPLHVDRGRITNSRPIVKVTSLSKVIWEQGRVAEASHTGRAVASIRSRNAVGQCGVAFIHEYG